MTDFSCWWTDFKALVYAQITIPLTEFQQDFYKKYYDRGWSPEHTFNKCFLK